MNAATEHVTRKGPASPFGPKQARPRSILLTELGERILDAAVVRTAASASNIVELLLRLHGGHVQPEHLQTLKEVADDTARR